jgi:hypothetical protein
VPGKITAARTVGLNYAMAVILRMRYTYVDRWNAAENFSAGVSRIPKERHNKFPKCH